MEVTLVIVTLLSLALAIGMATVAWRLLQEERQRAEARVAVLEEGLAASLAANPPAASAQAPTAISASAPPRERERERDEHHQARQLSDSGSGSRSDGSTQTLLTGEREGTGSSARIIDLHSNAEEPDWLAQFPSSTRKVNGWSTPSDRGSVTHVNGVSEGHGATGVRISDGDAAFDAPARTPDAATRSDAGSDAGLSHSASTDSASTNLASIDSASIDSASASASLEADLAFDEYPDADATAARMTGVTGFTSATDSPDHHATPASTAANRLFVQADEATNSAARGRSRGLLAVSVGAAVMVALILALWAVGRLIAPGTSADQQQAQQRTAAAAAATAAPLELVALSQTREGDALTISGVVRNPHAGASVDRLAAVVSFFDGAGNQLTSVRAPLDFRTLAPGDESPFQVTTTVPAGVSRYRVSFRRDEGTIVPHVDRRQQEAS